MCPITFAHCHPKLCPSKESDQFDVRPSAFRIRSILLIGKDGEYEKDEKSAKISESCITFRFLITLGCLNFAVTFEVSA